MRNTKKILLSILTVGVVAGAAFGASTAFFSDTETSTNNVLAAGAIDLKIDNTCYYNGQACINGFWGGQPDQNATNTCSCTWNQKDLTKDDIFFNLTDLKPGDWEEDTISLHVSDNDAWACADIKVTDHSDNGITEPEDEVDGNPNDGKDGTPDGDIAQELNFIFWNDDGDNVLEDGEDILTQGPANNVLGNVRWALADSVTQILEDEGPLVGSHDYFIGKAFCYGALIPRPLSLGQQRPYSPAADNNNDTVINSLDGGFECDGSQVGNISQTDQLTGDIVFEAVQARNNDNFLCNPSPTEGPG